MSYIPAKLKLQVEQRAAGRCEYCHLSQAGQEARFHVDHVSPSSAGGVTAIENLCLACVSCSLRKGARTHAADPETGTTVPLFNPRQHTWGHHFVWNGCIAEGITSTGRATIAALAMNRPLVIEIRREEQLLGRHPL